MQAPYIKNPSLIKKIDNYSDIHGESLDVHIKMASISKTSQQFWLSMIDGIKHSNLGHYLLSKRVMVPNQSKSYSINPFKI